jgi:predicted Zn-dependent protease
LNPNGANYAAAVQNLMLHEGLGHLFGLNDSASTSSMMGPGNGAVNDTTSNRAPSACDLAALEIRKQNKEQGARSCGILAL